MFDFDLLPRGKLLGLVGGIQYERATQQESKELLEEVMREIEKMPAANAVEAVHAHWRSDRWCSHCGAEKLISYHGPVKSNLFCHCCGAKMTK